MCGSIKRMMAENKKTVGLIFLQIMILAVVGGRFLLKPRVELHYDGKDIGFYYSAPEYIVSEEDGSHAVADGPADAEWTWYLNDVTLPRGEYTLQMEYKADHISEENTWASFLYENGSSTFEYVGNVVLKNTAAMHFRNGRSVVEQKELVKGGTTVHFEVHYGGGYFGVRRISLIENKWARFGVWLQILMIFVAIDVLWCVWFGESAARFSKWQKMSLFAIVATTLFVSLPAFADFLAQGHDADFHTTRIDCIAKAIKGGQFPVRIYTDAYNGYGYICPLFYGDIFLYYPALLHILGMPLFRAYQIYVITVNLLTCVISYHCFRKIFRDKASGLLGAVLYTCAAYRMINVHIRAAVGEYTAMMFLPMIVYAFWIMFSNESSERQRKNGWIMMAIGFTGVIQSHIISVEMTLVFSVLVCLMFVKKIFLRRNLLMIGKAVVAVVLGNLWFIVPFLEHVGGDYRINVTGGLFSSLYKSALYIPQVFQIFLRYGGGDVKNGMWYEMPLGIGLPLTIGLLGFFAYRAINGKTDKAEYRIGAVSAILGVAALWMTTIYFPWDKLEPYKKGIAHYLSVIQFPWRYLSIASVLLSVTAVAFSRLIRQKYGRRAWLTCIGILIGSNVLIIGYLFTDYMYYTGETTVICNDKEELILNSAYFPAGADERYADCNIHCDEGLEVLSYERTEKGLFIECVNDTADAREIRLPLYYYPDYRVTVDNESKEGVTLGAGEGKHLTVSVPPDFAGRLQVRFYIPPYWRVCEVISVLTWGVLLIWGIRKKIKAHNAMTE